MVYLYSKQRVKAANIKVQALGPTRNMTGTDTNFSQSSDCGFVGVIVFGILAGISSTLVIDNLKAARSAQQLDTRTLITGTVSAPLPCQTTRGNVGN